MISVFQFILLLSKQQWKHAWFDSCLWCGNTQEKRADKSTKQLKWEMNEQQINNCPHCFPRSFSKPVCVCVCCIITANSRWLALNFTDRKCGLKETHNHVALSRSEHEESQENTVAMTFTSAESKEDEAQDHTKTRPLLLSTSESDSYIQIYSISFHSRLCINNSCVM